MPEPNDIHKDELLPMMETLIGQGFIVFVKWTCPQCGERVTSMEPNAFHTGGYRHDDCGFLYTGDMFGIMMMTGFQHETDTASG